MSSLFDSWFGFIFWGMAYFRMRAADNKAGLKRNRVGDILSQLLNVFIILIGVFTITVGTYASVESIIEGFAAGSVGSVFQCASNAI